MTTGHNRTRGYEGTREVVLRVTLKADLYRVRGRAIQAASTGYLQEGSTCESGKYGEYEHKRKRYRHSQERGCEGRARRG